MARYKVETKVGIREGCLNLPGFQYRVVNIDTGAVRVESNCRFSSADAARLAGTELAEKNERADSLNATYAEWGF